MVKNKSQDKSRTTDNQGLPMKDLRESLNMNQAQFAADVIPDTQINELQEQVEESKLVFDEALPN